MQNRFRFRYLDNSNRMQEISLTDCYYTNLDYSRLMQSTGLRDINGKLIYEGDIIKYMYYNPKRYTKWSVVFNPDTLEFGLKDCQCIGYSRLTRYSIFNNKVEVIGNIYENPELLKDGE